MSAARGNPISISVSVLPGRSLNVPVDSQFVSVRVTVAAVTNRSYSILWLYTIEVHFLLT